MTPGEFIQQHQKQINEIFQKKYAEEIFCIVPTAHLEMSPDEVAQFAKVQHPVRPKRKVDPVDTLIRQKSIFISKNKWLSKEAIAIIERDFDNHLRTITHSKKTRLKINQLRDKQIVALYEYLKTLPFFKRDIIKQKSKRDVDIYKVATIFKVIAEIFAVRGGHDPAWQEKFIKTIKNAIYLK